MSFSNSRLIILASRIKNLKVYCYDCKSLINPDISPCPKHGENCDGGEAFVCPECDSLNIDYQVNHALIMNHLLGCEIVP